MFIAFGCDENLRFNDDYELLLEVDITDNKSFLDYYNYKTNFKFS